MGIGALIGGWTGHRIWAAHGATGWDMAGYILGGALIGGASGGAALGVSAAGGGVMLAGAGAGAVGGAGFSGLSTGWDGDAMLKGAAFGAISGFVGGGVGNAIGGGIGALAGGASSNLASQLLYNGGNFADVNWGSVAGSGAFSFGMYHGMQFASWQWGGGNKLGDLDITYRQFSKINTMYQRSHSIFGSRKENGLYINTKDGSARFVPRNDSYQDKVVFDDFKPGDAAIAHSHLRNQMTYASNSHSTDDILNLKGFNSLVVGRIGSSTMMGYQNLPHVLIQSNPYIRFFLFPWNY